MKSVFTFQQALKRNDHLVMPEVMTEYCTVLIKARRQAQPEDNLTSLVPGEQA